MMTWLKISDDFGDDCARAALSDAAVRTHVEGLSWVMRRETGGWLDRRDLRRFAETADPDAAVAELVAAGFWTVEGDGWVIVHHMEHQPEPDLIARRRENGARRQREFRRRQAGLDSGDVTEDVTPLRDALPGTGRDGGSSPLPMVDLAMQSPDRNAREAGHGGEDQERNDGTTTQTVPVDQTSPSAPTFLGESLLDSVAHRCPKHRDGPWPNDDGGCKACADLTAAEFVRLVTALDDADHDAAVALVADRLGGVVISDTYAPDVGSTSTPDRR